MLLRNEREGCRKQACRQLHDSNTRCRCRVGCGEGGWGPGDGKVGWRWSWETELGDGAGRWSWAMELELARERELGALPRPEHGTSRARRDERRESSESRARRPDNITSGNLHQARRVFRPPSVVRRPALQRGQAASARACWAGLGLGLQGLGHASISRELRVRARAYLLLVSLPSELHRLSVQCRPARRSPASAIVSHLGAQHGSSVGRPHATLRYHHHPKSIPPSFLVCPANCPAARPACAVHCDEDGPRHELHGATQQWATGT